MGEALDRQLTTPGRHHYMHPPPQPLGVNMGLQTRRKDPDLDAVQGRPGRPRRHPPEQLPDTPLVPPISRGQ
eukprot:2891003-Pyramimonas_sp.AAC.1